MLPERSSLLSFKVDSRVATLGQILSRPLTSPPTAVEKKAAAVIVKTMLGLSSSEVAKPSLVELLTAGLYSKKNSVCVCVHMSACMSACMCTCMCACKCMYPHIHV